MSTPWRATRRSSGHNGRCKHGFNCVNFRKNTCRFFHTAEDREKRAHSIDHYEVLLAQSRNRLSLLVEGLGDASAVLAGPKGAVGADAGIDTDAYTTAVPFPVGITAERVLGSFNKIADNKIAVPGCPPQFTPPTHTIQVKPDAAQPDGRDNPPFPTYTHGLEPLVRAVQCMTPDVDVLGGACDIVANAGSVYRLFNFLTKKLIMTTRYDLEWRPTSTPGGGILLMQPWKGDPNHDVSYGYGQSFAAATCHFASDLPAALQTSFSHHRVLYYELSGLRFAVHCEADGYYDPQHAATKVQLPLSPPVSPKLTMSTPASPRSKANGSRFSVLMEDVDEEEDETHAPPASATLGIDFPCGPAVPVPAAHLIELKTFNAKRFSDWIATGASPSRFFHNRPDSQLYFGRTPQLYEAGRDGGTFSPDVRVEKVAARLRAWEAENQNDLQRLVVFLRDLLQRASAHAAAGHTRLSLVLPGVQDPASKDKRARLYVRDSGVSFLPETL